MHVALAVAVAVALLGAIAALALGAALVAAFLAVLAVLPATALFTMDRQPRPQGGGPQTDHLVELYQVNSAPGEDQMEHFMYAQCGEAGCDFLEFADPEAADQEASLRAKVSVHAAKQSPVIQIYV